MDFSHYMALEWESTGRAVTEGLPITGIRVGVDIVIVSSVVIAGVDSNGP